MGEFFRRLRYLLHRRQYDRELQMDMEFHREMAVRAGRRNFGNTLRLREQSREAWGWMWLDRLWQDLRYAVRTLAGSPGFTITAILVLGLGIGVNVMAFSLFNQMVLKWLPVRNPDRLVRLQRRSPENSASEMPYPFLTFYREHAKTLSAVMGMIGAPPMELQGDAQGIKNIFVTSNYFTELGTSAAYGRLFDPARENAPDAVPVVVLDYGFWQRRFAADPSIVGKTIYLNKKPATIIGVTSYAFVSLDQQHTDVWLPITQYPYFIEGSQVLTDTTSFAGTARMWGRLAPGVTAKAAEQELRVLTNELRKLYPKEIWEQEFLKSDPAGHFVVMQKDQYQVLAMVGALGLLILTVACSNLGGLLLARGITREHEISIRIAIGAGKKRIFRQLFTESLLLALLGALAGVTLSYFLLRLILAKTNIPAWMQAGATPDWRILLFAVGMALAAVFLFGLTPALQIARQRQRKILARQILIGAQVTASCILLIIAGLLVRAVHHELYSDPGFGYEQVLSIDPGLERHGYTPAAARAYLDQLENRLRAVPGVISVAMSSMPPMGHGRVAVVGTEIGRHPVEVYPYQVDPAFFRTMGIPLLAGRNLLPNEAGAVIVNQSLAQLQWPGENPVGKQFWNKDTVVGVAGNARMIALNDSDAMEIYHAAQVADMPGMIIEVKTAGAPDNFVPLTKTIVQSLDPKLYPMIGLLKAAFRQNMQPVENAVMVASLLGIVAAFLAGLGIVGLVAYAVSQRMKEIAIRVALGAGRMQVLSTVLRQFSWPVTLGLLIGVGVTAGLSKLLRQILYGVSNLDPLSYVSATAVLMVILAIAALLPAKRALQVNLSKILHYE